ncbi:hypothetical protein GCM10025790_00380 [Nesterenkonia rhizosphaerae]|uniref:Ribosome maturation factor RimP n=2 Tax=Nesterenkonia rhizosphaerae TaxID=1348272 RepID=A0ABP9FPF9_9MICC
MGTMAVSPRASSDRRFPDERTAALGALIEPIAASHGLYLEELQLKPSGADTVLRVVVDYETGTEQVDLDTIAELSQGVSEGLDKDDPLPDVDSYELEVSTPGATRPLTEPRHFRRNMGRLLEIERAGEPVLSARLKEVDDDGVTVAEIKPAPKKGMVPKTGPDTHIPYASITRARVQVEFSHTEE